MNENNNNKKILQWKIRTNWLVFFGSFFDVTFYAANHLGCTKVKRRFSEEKVYKLSGILLAFFALILCHHLICVLFLTLGFKFPFLKILSQYLRDAMMFTDASYRTLKSFIQCVSHIQTHKPCILPRMIPIFIEKPCTLQIKKKFLKWFSLWALWLI